MMDLTNKIITKLKQKNLKYKKSGESYILSQCLNPNHKDNHPSFSINIKTGIGFCFTCDYKVNKRYWLGDEYNDELEREDKYLSLLNKLQKPTKREKEKSFSGILPPFGKEINDGWRGLTKETITKYNLYICLKGKYKNRVIFPFYENNELKGFNSRALDNSTPKYLYSTGIDLKDLIYPYFDKSKEIVIVEGVMDALSLVQDNIPSIANLGLSINFNSNKINKLISKGVTKLWLMFDNDKAGKEAYKKFFNSELNDYFDIDYAFNNHKLKPFYASKCKDYNEFIQYRDR